MRILEISDTHVGSYFGLWHPSYEIGEENTKRTVNLSPMQGELYNDWLIMRDEVKSDPPDVAVLNGDLVDGVQRKSFGREAITTDMDEQAGCFRKLWDMIPLKDKTAVYVTAGSGYHESQYSNIHKSICEHISGNAKENFLGDGGSLRIQKYKYRLWFAHWSSAAFIYLEQALARERVFMLASSTLSKTQYQDLICFAHVHTYAEVKTIGQRLHDFPGLKSKAVVTQKMVTSPCFQAQTNYMRKKSTFKLIPDIGYLIIEVDDNGVHVKERLFPPVIINEKVRKVD